MKTLSLERARRLLCSLEAHIRDTLLAARPAAGAGFARIAAVTAADTIYAVDKLSEDAIFAWFDAHWPAACPVQIIMEGIEDHEAVTFPRGTPIASTTWKCILDPIDGTRNLMYDKRSAWVLGALAPQRGRRNHLGDLVVAAMTEIPTSKMWRSDQISGIRGRGCRAEAHDVRDRSTPPQRLRLRPSQATDFRHGFASFARFFPDGKALTAELEEALWRELHGASGASPLVFDDQYISTGGQIAELLAGHDRLLGDLRPLVFARLGITSSLTCHPYDICTAFLLAEAGGVIESPDGRPLRAPLDTTSPVAWVGYANPTLARLARPVLRRLVGSFLSP